MLARRAFVASVLLSWACSTPIASAAIPASERQALLDFYASTGGGTVWFSFNWGGPAGTECQWDGIACDATGTHVVTLELGDLVQWSGQRLGGSLPASINQLTELTVLDVSYNSICGPVPDLSSLTALTGLYLDSNCFTGPLPDVGSLPNLQIFAADQNQFTGPVPDLHGSTQLTTFTASRNFLTGTLPSLAGLAALQTFDVSANMLSGSIPPIAGSHALASVQLSDNRLTGNLPAFDDVPSLARFVANDNLLSGSIPSLSNATSLADFEVHTNMLSGELPDLTGSQLVSFDVSDNDLSGPLPSLAGQNGLTFFSVEYNHLSGTLSSLAGLTALQTLRIAYNNFEGDLPAVQAETSGYYSSSLCPNALTPEPDANWDAATQTTPWYAACVAPPPNINQFGISGSWYNPQAPGSGYVLDSMPNADGSSTLFGGYFAMSPYDDDVNNQRWFTLQGNVAAGATSALLGVYATDTGEFAAPSATTLSLVSRARVTFSDCTNGAVVLVPQLPGGGPITRLTASTNCGQDGDNGHAPSNALLSGAWYDPDVPGQGFLIDISAEQHTLFIAWYTYAYAGAHPTLPYRWYTMQLENVPSGEINLNRVPIYSTLGNDPEHYGQQITERVGSAQVEFDGCNALVLAYSFTSGENALLGGILHLQRLGPPPPQCPY